MDNPYICSAGEPALGLSVDTIPLTDVNAWGHFTDDCRMIVGGGLNGCIAYKAACRICSYTDAPDYAAWEICASPEVEVPEESCDWRYCHRHCGEGTGWVKFGGMVGLAPRTCPRDIDGDGAADFGLVGRWCATEVPFQEDAPAATAERPSGACTRRRP